MHQGGVAAALVLSREGRTSVKGGGVEGGLWGVYVCVCVSTHSAMHCNRLPICLDTSPCCTVGIFRQ